MRNTVVLSVVLEQMTVYQRPSAESKMMQQYYELINVARSKVTEYRNVVLSSIPPRTGNKLFQERVDIR